MALAQTTATITQNADDPRSLDVQLGALGFTLSLDQIAATMRNADPMSGFIMQAGLALAEAGQDTNTDFATLLATLQNYSYVVSL